MSDAVFRGKCLFCSRGLGENAAASDHGCHKLWETRGVLVRTGHCRWSSTEVVVVHHREQVEAGYARIARWYCSLHTESTGTENHTPEPGIGRRKAKSVTGTRAIRVRDTNSASRIFWIQTAPEKSWSSKCVQIVKMEEREELIRMRDWEVYLNGRKDEWTVYPIMFTLLIDNHDVAVLITHKRRFLRTYSNQYCKTFTKIIEILVRFSVNHSKSLVAW